MSAGSIKDQTMSIDTIVDNGGNITKQAVEANTYDVTVKFQSLQVNVSQIN